jgi:hypothetical protein
MGSSASSGPSGALRRSATASSIPDGAPAIAFHSSSRSGSSIGRQVLEALAGERREGRDRALAEDLRRAEAPVEEVALKLLDLAGEPPEGARGVDPHEGIRVQKKGLQRLQRGPDELGIGRVGHAAHAHLEAPRGEDAPAQGAVRGAPDHRVERGARAPQPRSQLRDLQRARAGLPDQDLQPRAGLHVVRERERGAVAEQRSAPERVEQRAFHHAVARDLRDRGDERGLLRGAREHLREAHVAAPRAPGAPREHRRGHGSAGERAQREGALGLARDGRERVGERVRLHREIAGEAGTFRSGRGPVRAGAPPGAGGRFLFGPLREGGGEPRERFQHLGREHGGRVIQGFEVVTSRRRGPRSTSLSRGTSA